MGPLIISPHLDDEVLGCASFLQEPEVSLCYVTHLHPAFPDGTIVRENERLIEWLGLPNEKLIRLDKPANRLDVVPDQVLFTLFEEVINDVKPDTVLIPYPGYNQDHRAVYEAALTAMRIHDTHHLVKRILVYEQLEVFGTLRKVEPFSPTYFRPLDVEFKCEALSHYQSQLRGHRTLDHIRAQARVRGYQAGTEFAEAFEVARWIE